MTLYSVFKATTDFKVKFDENLLHSYEDMVEVLQTKKAQIMDARGLHESTVVDRKILYTYNCTYHIDAQKNQQRNGSFNS